MKRVLVTGSSGQLGSELCRILETNTDYELYTPDSSELNISDVDCVERYMCDKCFDFIVNCAAYTNVDSSETEILSAHETNYKGVSNIVKYNNTSKLIHISTDYVFDGNKNQPYNETDIENPLNVYGISKLYGEQQIDEGIIIRTSWLYSCDGNNFVNKIIKLLYEKQQLKIVYDQIGTPTYCENLAYAIIDIMEHDDWCPGIYNYSDEGVTSWYDFAMFIKQYLNNTTCEIIPCLSSEINQIAERPKYSVLNKNKIKNTFNVTTKHWTIGLMSCLNKKFNNGRR